MKNHTPAPTAARGTFGNEAAALILNNLPDAVLFFDRSLRLAAFNRKAEADVHDVFRIKLSTGLPALSLVSNKRQRAFKTLVRDVLQGQAKTMEHPVPLSPRRDEVYETTLSPARDGSGEIVGMLVRSVNVTERRKAGRAVQEAEERWQFAFEASGQAAWDWNMQTDEVIYSSSYKKMYGFLGHELRNNLSEWQDRIHPEDKKRLEAAVEEHSRSNDPFHETTYRIRVKGGDYKWIMARGKVVSRDAEGRPLRMIGTHTDLTETLRRKEEIRQMNERFHYAAKASSQALWEWNPVTGEAYVSPSFTEMFGWKADENRHFDQWHQYVHPDDRPATIDGYYHTLYHTVDTVWDSVYRFLKADGAYAFVHDRAYILRNAQNGVLKVFGATQDVTALRRAEEELSRSNERYDIFLKATNELIWEWDIGSNEIHRPKEGVNKVYGIADESTIRSWQSFLERIHPDESAAVSRKLKEVLAGEHMQVFELEFRIQGDDGLYRDIYGRGILLKSADGKPVRLIGSEQNISERKRLERELLQNELETKKRINQATVDSQEQERNQIGRELHDNVNQVLTTTKLYLELAASNPDMGPDLLARSVNNINDVIAEIRQLSRSLMDPSIGDLGILASLHDLAENLNLTQKIRIHVAADECSEDALDRNQKLTVFRIVQEALNNVLRHANATFVAIDLRTEADAVMVEVTDDGSGFATAAVKKGAGLKNISNRVYLVNGRLWVQSSPGNGCTLRIRIPIKNQQ